MRTALDDHRKQALIEVIDAGPGIPQDQIPHIFDRFYRVHTGCYGIGLGLSFVKEWVDRHGGRIAVASGEGQGCRFSLSFPLAGAEGSRAHSGDVETTVSNVALSLLASEIDDGGDWRDPMVPPVGDAAAEVLVVEDHPQLALYLKEQLEKTYKGRFARDGKEGLDQAQKWMPDLIVSDVMMPEMDGMAMTAALKADVRTSHIPVLLLTAKAAMEDKLTGLEKGADDYLVKPFHTKELLLRVRNQLVAREAWRQHIRSAPSSEDLPDGMPAADREFINRVHGIVTTHIDQVGFGVAAMASEVGLSNRQLQRKLLALTGDRPLALIRKIRLETAADMLRKGKGNVATIAYATGFESPAYFSKLFRQKYGRPPSRFRRTAESKHH